jgi:hypothetical protein
VGQVVDVVQLYLRVMGRAAMLARLTGLLFILGTISAAHAQDGTTTLNPTYDGMGGHRGYSD